MVEERFHSAVAAFDAAHDSDPSGKALREAERLSAWVLRLEPNASLPLRLAARCQHIERWKVPRSDFPAGRVGYLQWRTHLARFHADRAAAILTQVGFDQETVQAVRRINLKQNLRSSSDTQTMEDALCLVFLEYEFEDFLAKYPDEDKAVSILQKTSRKMSERGQRAALSLPLPARSQALVQRALSEPRKEPTPTEEDN